MSDNHGLYDVWETPAGRFRRWHSSKSIECMDDKGVWQSIPDAAQREIMRLIQISVGIEDPSALQSAKAKGE